MREYDNDVDSQSMTIMALGCVVVVVLIAIFVAGYLWFSSRGTLEVPESDESNSAQVISAPAMAPESMSAGRSSRIPA